MPTKRKLKKSVLKKKTPREASSVKLVNKNYLRLIITSLIILIVVAAVAATYSVIRTAQLKKQASTSQFLTVQDKEKNKTYQIPINPASVSIAASQSPVTVNVIPQNNNVTNPSAVTTTGKKSFRQLLKPVASKETINRIDLDQAKYLYKSGKALFIDARALTEYQEAHIAGAIPIPAGSAAADIPKFANVLKDKVLVSYCHGVGCHLSDKTAYALYDAGYRKVCIFFGGWPQWTQANLPITKKGDAK